MVIYYTEKGSKWPSNMHEDHIFINVIYCSFGKDLESAAERNRFSCVQCRGSREKPSTPIHVLSGSPVTKADYNIANSELGPY